jgi:hypothetical protein
MRHLPTFAVVAALGVALGVAADRRWHRRPVEHVAQPAPLRCAEVPTALSPSEPLAPTASVVVTKVAPPQTPKRASAAKPVPRHVDVMRLADPADDDRDGIAAL